jgi:hypothetical protein
VHSLGYDPTEIGETERILPTAITERLVIGADGELKLVTPGSTKPVAQIVMLRASARWSRIASICRRE